METSVNAIVVFTLVYLVVPGAVALRAFRFPREGQLAEWARTYGLDLTEDNRPVVIGYLRTARRFRAVGGAGGWFIGGLPLLIGQPLPLGIDNLSLALAGYFGGAALAELRFSRRGAGPTPRRASLVPREVDDYVAPWVRRVVGGGGTHRRSPRRLRRTWPGRRRRPPRHRSATGRARCRDGGRGGHAGPTTVGAPPPAAVGARPGGCRRRAAGLLDLHGGRRRHRQRPPGAVPRAVEHLVGDAPGPCVGSSSWHRWRSWR